MTQTAAHLAEQLADLVAEETGLLDALDFAAAGRLLPAKQALTEALRASRSEPAEETEDLRDALARLAAVAEENEAALRRSLAVQTKLMSLIAETVPKARAGEAPIYRANGDKIPFRPPQAYAFLKRM